MNMPGDSEEWERFWEALRRIETRIDAKLEGIERQVQAMQTDLDVERRRSLHVRVASGRNKWTSLVAAVIAVLGVIAQAWGQVQAAKANARATEAERALSHHEAVR